MKLSDKIRKLRGKKKQKVFAYELSLKPAIISEYETDRKKPSLGGAIHLAKVTGVDLNWLLLDDNINEEPVYRNGYNSTTKRE